MKLALLGIDRFVRLAADAIARSREHEIALVCEEDRDAAGLLRAHPQAIREAEWENLLAARDFDLLLVGTGRQSDELRTEQLRRFVQEGVPLVVVQPAAEAIVLHELAMIQKDSRSVLATWNPIYNHPAVKRIGEILQPCESDISHVSFQRAVREPTWRHVMQQVARDAQWVRHLIGPPDRVTALAPALYGEELQNLSMTFVSPSGAMAQWTLARAAGGDSVSVGTSQGSAAWMIARDGSTHIHFETQSVVDDVHWTTEESDQKLGNELLGFMADTLENSARGTTFDDATRAVELAEAAHESNRRSRTIHLHYEEHSEQQTFKSVMAAGGCLMLLAVLFVLGASIVIDSIGAPVRNNPWWRIWPIYLLAPVVLFLLLQTLWRVFAPAKG